jgi:predicted SAM-dependent methyltransferase
MKLLNLGCGQRHHPEWTNMDFNSTTPDVMAHDMTTGIPFPDNSFDVIYHSHLLEHFSKRFAPVFLEECHRVLKSGGIIRVVVPDLETIVRLYLENLEGAIRGDEEAQNRYEWLMLELFDQMVRNRSGGEMLEYWKRNPMPEEDFVIERVGSEVLNVLTALRAERKSPEAGNAGGGRNRKDSRDPVQMGWFRLSGEVHQWMYDRYSLKVLLLDAGFGNIRQCRADESAIPDFNKYLLDVEADGAVRKPDSLFMEAVRP